MLAASVEHHARAQPARQQAAHGEIPSQAKLPPSPCPQGLEPAWEGLLAISVGLLCFLMCCAGPHGTSSGLSCCSHRGSTARGPRGLAWRWHEPGPAVGKPPGPTEHFSSKTLGVY